MKCACMVIYVLVLQSDAKKKTKLMRDFFTTFSSVVATLLKILKYKMD